MLSNAAFAGSALSLRPAGPLDAPFLELLYRSARPDLEQLDATPEQIEALAAQQHAVLLAGAGAEFPNAMHFVVARTTERVGALIVDFGPNEVRLIYLALLPVLRGQGCGRQLVEGLQQAAARVQTPLAVTVWRNNPRARALYLQLGFVVEEAQPTTERLVWYPSARPMIVVP
jgi:ribosomal protein S18 acetylase RimI-like enzyme